jgi:hypothetical protein
MRISRSLYRGCRRQPPQPPSNRWQPAGLAEEPRRTLPFNSIENSEEAGDNVDGFYAVRVLQAQARAGLSPRQAASHLPRSRRPEPFRPPNRGRTVQNFVAYATKFCTLSMRLPTLAAPDLPPRPAGYAMGWLAGWVVNETTWVGQSPRGERSPSAASGRIFAPSRDGNNLRLAHC